MGGGGTVAGERLRVTEGECGLILVLLLELESQGGSKDGGGGAAVGGGSERRNPPFEVAMGNVGLGRSLTSFSAKFSSIRSYFPSSTGSTTYYYQQDNMKYY